MSVENKPLPPPPTLSKEELEKEQEKVSLRRSSIFGGFTSGS